MLVLEEEVFHDASFKRSLCDAIESIPVGSAWDLTSRMGPLIRPPQGELETGLKELEPGESWAVMPRFSDQNPHLVTPAVKWNVQPGSFTHMTEFFGPLLGVMSAKNLEHAIRLVNQTGYDIVRFYGSNKGSKSWEEDILGKNILSNGSSVVVNFNDGTGYCKFDFQAVFEDGDVLVKKNSNI